MLEIEFLAYEPADFGVTAVIPGFGYLADLFPEPYLVKWEIADGFARSEELPGVAVPEDTFAGVVGVAPSHERLERVPAARGGAARRGRAVADPVPESAVPPEAADGLRTIPPRETGGNLDIRQLVAGSRLWLPVDVPGALSRSATSTSRRATARCAAPRSRSRARSPCASPSTTTGAAHRASRRYETPARPGRRSFATTGIPVDAGMDLNAAAREALLEMIDHLERTYGFEPAAAYALCSAVVDLRLSEVVDVPYPIVSALLPLDVFESFLSGTA